MKARRSLILGFAAVSVALVALLALVLLSGPAKYSPQRRRLPDGSFLKIVSISYDTKHDFVVPPRQPWKAFLVAHLPPPWTARLGWWADSSSVSLAHQPGEGDLALFTICELAGPKSFSSRPTLELCDEQGIIYDSVSEAAVAGGFDGKHDWKLVGWKVSHIPRNSKRLSLRFSELSPDGKTRQPLAEFSIPNPAKLEN
jgi:hypothetical protein